MFTIAAEHTFNTTPEKLWDWLTKPELVKQYLFGTEMSTTWEVGTPITYKGVWEGTSYEDKGKVLAFEPHSRIVCTYWSSFSGLPDQPENYQMVTYEIFQIGIGLKLVITQENNPTQESANHSKSNWNMTLEKMSKLLADMQHTCTK